MTATANTTAAQRQREDSVHGEAEEMEEEEEVEVDIESVEEGKAEKEGFIRTNHADDIGVMGSNNRIIAPQNGSDIASI